MGFSSDFLVVAAAIITGLCSVFVGVIAAVPGIYAIISSNRKHKADAAKIYTEISLSLIAPLRAKVVELEVRIQHMQTSFEIERAAWVARIEESDQLILELLEIYSELLRGLDTLTSQLTTLGEIPSFTLDDSVIERISAHIKKYKREHDGKD